MTIGYPSSTMRMRADRIFLRTMADGVFCNDCGAPIIGESSNGDPAQRKPCPQCGSLARRYIDTGTVGLGLKGSGIDVFIPYPEALLTKADDMITKNEFRLAVIVDRRHVRSVRSA